MTVLSMRQVRRAFTLVELLVVISIIGVLVALLLPALSSARAAANLSGSSSNLSSFGRAFELYANENNGRYTSGAFDHYRDGDIRQVGWVADVVNQKVASPGAALDIGSRNKYNEKVGDFTGSSKNTKAGAAGRTPYWDERGLSGAVVTGLAALKGENGLGAAALTANEAREIIPVYNSNYATTWHFSRGDPSATDGYAGGSKCPDAGDGGLTFNHIAQGRAPAARIALMGPARAGDGGDAQVVATVGTENAVTTGVAANLFNAFAGKTLVKTGDLLVESFNDGMEVSAASAFGGGSAEKLHGFNDIEPLHQAKNSDGSGGTAPILFADGHVAKILDTVTAGSSSVKKGDSFLGAGVSRNSAGGVTGFVIDNASYNELADQVWLKRLRTLQTAGGAFNEVGQ